MVSTSGCAKTMPSESPSNSVLDELLVLPQAMPSTSKRRKAINHKAKEVTDLSILQDMKDKAQAEEEAKRIKEEKRLERARKAKERQVEKEKKKLEREKRAQERKMKKDLKKAESSRPKQKAVKQKASPVDIAELETLFFQMEVDDGQCFSCGMAFRDEDDEERFWVCCDKCDEWFCFACHNFSTKDSVPEYFYCVKCE